MTAVIQLLFAVIGARLLATKPCQSLAALGPLAMIAPPRLLHYTLSTQVTRKVLALDTSHCNSGIAKTAIILMTAIFDVY